ncbi:MAG: hypothetical protein U0794_13720 [Isosphaeraceae bacterium]
MFTTEPSLPQRIERMVADCPIVDPIALVDPGRRGDLCLTRMLEPVFAEHGGLPSLTFGTNSSAPEEETLAGVLPRLARTRHTAVGWCFHRILRDLFDVHEPQLDASNLADLLDRIQAASQDASWSASVYRRANLVAVANASGRVPVSPGIQWIDATDRARLVRESASAFLSLHEIRDQFARLLAGVAPYCVMNLADLGERAAPASDQAIDPLEVLLELVNDHRRAAILRVGSPDQLSTLATLLDRYRHARFGLLIEPLQPGFATSLLAQGDEWARVRSNVIVIGHGRTVLTASAVAESLSHRLQVLANSSFAGFASQAATPEWVYGRFQLVRKATSHALAHMVEAGFYEEHELPPLLRRIFHDNLSEFLDLPHRD